LLARLSWAAADAICRVAAAAVGLLLVLLRGGLIFHVPTLLLVPGQVKRESVPSPPLRSPCARRCADVADAPMIGPLTDLQPAQNGAVRTGSESCSCKMRTNKLMNKNNLLVLLLLLLYFTKVTDVGTAAPVANHTYSTCDRCEKDYLASFAD
jgi:hypothetical protein